MFPWGRNRLNNLLMHYTKLLNMDTLYLILIQGAKIVCFFRIIGIPETVLLILLLAINTCNEYMNIMDCCRHYIKFWTERPVC